MDKHSLFDRYQMKHISLKNRIVMAPMTRARSSQPGNIPTALMADYYQQRASAGLVITEATQISPQGQGYSWTPGIHSAEQIAGWRRVTQAVHHAGGIIFSQLWHVGRMSHARFHADGKPVAPSALPSEAKVWVVNEKGEGQMVDCTAPRALSHADIQQVIEDYRQAAINAVEAGFDGIEVHGGNGYLVDQFLRRTSNHRTDEYGGSLVNRIRFAQEVLASISDAIGSERTGIRLSPFITQRGMNDPQVIDAILALAAWCDKKGIAYIHLAEADWDDAPQVPLAFREALRATFNGTLIVAGNYTRDKADKILHDDLADLVAFGRPFISNPDLTYRLKNHLPLEEINDPATLFGGSDKGYTDYPVYHSTDVRNRE
ncbi:alkene reductase [Kosakonia sp. WA-90]|uniref:alkene reductase n=1 Tax=Kosakonia sp. WA-90 TaxID=3153576 RepID=UPI00325CB8B6